MVTKDGINSMAQVFKSPLDQANAIVKPQKAKSLNDIPTIQKNKGLNPQLSKEINDYIDEMYRASEDDSLDDDERYIFDGYSFKDINEAIEDGFYGKATWDDFVNAHINYLANRGVTEDQIKSPLVSVEDLKKLFKN